MYLIVGKGRNEKGEVLKNKKRRKEVCTLFGVMPSTIVWYTRPRFLFF